MNKLKHYLIGYSLVLLLNAVMLAVVCPKAKASLSTRKTVNSESNVFVGGNARQ